MRKLFYLLLITSSLWLTACSVNKQIGKNAKQTIFSDYDFAGSHIGIHIYEPSEKKLWYSYQGNKYFVPASNVKLFTCYAAMKYLGDSLRGLDYFSNDTAIWIRPTADPTFLLSEFKYQPVYNFLANSNQKVYYRYPRSFPSNGINPFGRGWAWDDYNASYMAERNEMPIYGNLVKFYFEDSILKASPNVFYQYYKQSSYDRKRKIEIERNKDKNEFYSRCCMGDYSNQFVPFKTDKNILFQLLEDTLNRKIITKEAGDLSYGFSDSFHIIHSQPTDTLLKRMMHRSDNFFAEQILLMIGNEKLSEFNDKEITNKLLDDFFNFYSKPKWVDGSGLSRYNLFTPQDFVQILNQMKNEFKWERISSILPTGNEGTLAGYYKNYVGKIYAKTGTLSNNVSLSGFITTKKGKQLIFSILVNNHQTSASDIRRAIEKFLTSLMDAN